MMARLQRWIEMPQLHIWLHKVAYNDRAQYLQ